MKRGSFIALCVDWLLVLAVRLWLPVDHWVSNGLLILAAIGTAPLWFPTFFIAVKLDSGGWLSWPILAGMPFACVLLYLLNRGVRHLIDGNQYRALRWFGISLGFTAPAAIVMHYAIGVWG